MKVAIFGDSYADEKIHKREAKYKSWVEILREKYYPDLACYGEAGSSLYFSYGKFLDNHSKYDKIIFVTTTNGRITIPSYIKFKEHADTYLMYHLNGVETANSHIVDRPFLMTEEGILATKAAIEYFKYLHDPIYDSRMRSLMKDSIKNIRPDSIIVDTLNPGLSDISYYEFCPHGDRPAEMWEYNDHRMCHLSKRNNEILAEKMFEWSNGTPVHINFKDFEVPSREELFQLLVK
jgi:hypothetical protein